MDITGIALVTGAGSGIGKACAHAYAVEGAAGVVFADLNRHAAEEAALASKSLATNENYRFLVIQVDVTNEKSVEEMIQSVLAEFERIDYAINCAGIGVKSAAEIGESSISEFKRFLDVNVLGMFLAVRAETKAMKMQEPRTIGSNKSKRGESRGVIINMGSCSSYCATPQLVQYTTSKHAVLGLTRNAALDNAEHLIRVNSICPSWVDTPMVQEAVEGNPALKTMMEKAIPMGRIAQPEEIADVAMFLSSPRSSYVTGSGWIVDGGTTLTNSTMATEGIDFVTDGFPAPGLRKTQRFITAHDSGGRSYFETSDHGDHHRVMGEKQAVANILYSTKENPVELNGDVDIKFAKENEPGLHIPNGTVVRLIDFAPGLESPIHRAMSIDYGIVLNGEFELTLDSGESRIMKQGDVSVQRATAHKWKNITGGGAEPGRMLYVLLDCKDVVVNGKKLEGFLGDLEKEYEGRSA